MDTTQQRMAKTLRLSLQELADATTPDLTMRQLLVLLDVASLGIPIAQFKLGDRHGLSKGTTSRIVANLAGTEGDIKHIDGFGLVDVNLDATDLRNRLISLSKKGDRVMTRALDKVR